MTQMKIELNHFFKSLSLLLLLCCFGYSVFAQKGTIEGVVSDSKTNEPLFATTVYIDVLNIGGQTDTLGLYKIKNIPEGKYNVKFYNYSYEPIVLEGIEIKSGEVTKLNISLEPQSIALNAANITGVRKVTTDAGVINTVKKSQTVVSGISSQQIQKSQDRDASEVVKRIPGITIMDDRFIVVRGLTQRYNNVWVNNAPVPSSETDIRAFSFDVIPSGLIDNILIYKNCIPELPCDVVGGFIKITTKNMPDSNFVSVDYSASYRQGTTGETFHKYEGSKTDWLGYDNGTRALPAKFPTDLSTASRQTVDNLGKAFNSNWTTTQTTARPDNRFGISVGRRFKVGKILFGNTTALTYSNSLDTRNLENNSYSVYNLALDKPTHSFQYHDNMYTNNVKTSVLHNWSIVLSDKHRFEFSNFFNQLGFNRTTFRDGFDYNRASNVRAFEYRFMSRSTYAGQFGGNHILSENTKANWNVNYSYANRKEPDRKIITTQPGIDTTKYLLQLASFANPRQAGRLYLENYENIYGGGINLEHKLTVFSIATTLKTGFLHEYKNRSFAARNIGYSKGDSLPNSVLELPFDQVFVDSNLSYDKIRIDEKTNKSDSYTAYNSLYAGYFAINIPIGNLIIYTGVRAENNHQSLSSYATGSIDDEIKVNNQKTDFFPSANISYGFTEKILGRVAYSKSVNRPEFREIAPFNFFDFNDYAGIYGNDTLRNAYVHNFDARLEYYPASGEMFSLAVFYKKFNDPIEMVYLEGGSGLLYGFHNSKSAVSQGIELEMRKSLKFIEPLKNFTGVFNGTLIKSGVKFIETANYGGDERTLQGQSPYIFNAGLFYDDPKLRLMVSLLYNLMGPRIMIVGKENMNSNDNIPDVYQAQSHQLDLTFSKKIASRFELKGGVKNILSESQTLQQTFDVTLNNGEKVERTLISKQFFPGRMYSLGVSFKF